MDQGVLSIRWDTGHMDILLDAFFPCSMDKFKKLLKVIDLDWEHADTLKETLKVYFQEQISAKKKYLETAENPDEPAHKTAKRTLQRFERLLQILTKKYEGVIHHD